jgi:DNA-binding transcriptional MerR regulator
VFERLLIVGLRLILGPSRMMTMDHLVEQTLFPERTIRKYIKQGLIPGTERGRGHYDEKHVLLLRAIGRMQSEGVRSVLVMRARLDAMSPKQLRKFVEHEDEEEGEEARAATTATAPVVQAPAAPAEPRRQEWQRIVLGPGLELHVRRDAREELRRWAEEVAVSFGATS